MNKILTTAEATQLLGLSQSRVKQLILKGQLPAVKHGRDYMINSQDVLNMERRPAGRPKRKEGE